MTGRVLHYAITAVPDDQRYADRSDQIHEREKDCVIKNRIDVRTAIVLVDMVEFAERLCFRVEDLNCLCPGKVLLQEGVDAGDARAHEVVAFARAASKPGGRKKEERHRQ